MKRVACSLLVGAVISSAAPFGVACGSSRGDGNGSGTDAGADATVGSPPGQATSDGGDTTVSTGGDTGRGGSGGDDDGSTTGTGSRSGGGANGLDSFGLPIPPTSLTTAVAAKNFLSTIGINIGLGAGNAKATQAQYIALLQYLGVTWVRGGFASSSFAEHLAIAQATGIKSSYLTYGSSSTKIDTQDIPNATQLADAGLLLFLEGPNEPDVYGTNWNDAGGGKSGSWAPVSDAQIYWYAAIKKNATLAKYPVANITHSGAEEQNYGLQFLIVPPDSGVTLVPEGTTYADYATMHNYVMWLNASSTYETTNKENLAWNNAAPTGHIAPTQDPFQIEYVKTWKHGFTGYSADDAPNVPHITTETGWETGIGADGGTDTSEPSGKLMLATYIDQFARGYRLTSWYQLLDNEGGFNNTYGMYTDPSTPKIVATYLHNMTTILADAANDFTPGTLDWSIANQPATVHGLLLQKKNGHFWLCLTDEHWPAGSDAFSVALGKSFATVNVYDPTIGTASQKTLANVSSVPLTMTDHPLFLEAF